MNATAQSIAMAPYVGSVPGSKVGKTSRNRLVLQVIVGSIILTAVALYSLFLTQRLDSIFYEIDTKKIENAALQREIGVLEGQVNSLKSLNRVENILKEAGIQLSVPASVFYLDVAKAHGQIARESIRATGKESI